MAPQPALIAAEGEANQSYERRCPAPCREQGVEPQDRRPVAANDPAANSLGNRRRGRRHCPRLSALSISANRTATRAAVQETLLIAIALSAYLGVRFLVRDSGGKALDNAATVIHAETILGLAREIPLQHLLLRHPGMVRLLNRVYIWGYWPVLAVSLCYLYARRRDVYRSLRNAMIISGLIGLLIFASFPVAPPRLTAMGVHDTIRLYDPTCQELARPSALINQNAAMPSFHFGWVLLCGACMAMVLRRRAGRALALTLPLLMGLAVVATGNHYIVDTLVGGALSLVGLACGRFPFLRREGKASGT